jgi:hypothetical protein
MLAHSKLSATERLKALAAWYRLYAERAGSSTIWDFRLSTAEDLERQAAGLEQLSAGDDQYRRKPLE